MRGVPERPDGLLYEPDLLTEEDEAELLARFDQMRFDAVVMHGQAARRTVRHFGFGYDFESWELTPTEPIPTFLRDTLLRSARLAREEPGFFEQALVTRYPPGAAIGWHRDAAAFGAVVAGVSLGAHCALRFQHRAAGGERRVYEQALERRSAYVLSGAARATWQHSIPPVEATRYSITFRTVRRSGRP